MNLEFLSGLALIAVTLGVLAYLITEFFDIRIGDLKNVRRNIAEAFEKRESREAKPINSHLIGVIGKVTAHSDDNDRPMRVRLSLESWPARLSSAADALAPVGASVKVIEVDGPVLIVEAIEEAEASPPASN
jgi:membrane protein implicated in regulation of membrane protease activity